MTVVLEVTDLRHNYGDTNALAGVSLSVAPGEFVALLEPNGAGKTTLVRSVVGLIRPDSGKVTVAGGNPAHAAVRRPATSVHIAVADTQPVDEPPDLVGLLRAQGLTFVRNGGRIE